ncbi:hypothetical protein VA7868_04218 [Vibrio aerogenes CECT 7868]|uniref:Uncharacterized protein n=1 Tax=Vibrio aerogenes CECT 7868 TaxID=1216006 RepID=A0A1M6DFP3_9VIBR|nr:DUF4405 domain-containing protein [Vibrio aerogenes]SHI72002.1 hypothetical protein VA7868_04218 [Vibrio aerogenes CECT 7868]
MMKMNEKLRVRIWSTPLTIGSFILMSLSGILMFFDIVPGYISFVHEWFSWIFLLAVAGHLTMHFRPLKNHLQSVWGRTNVVIFTLILLISGFSFGRITAPQLKWPIAEILVNAPLSALADAKRVRQETFIQNLASHGILAEPGQTIRELAHRYDTDEFHLLGLIILDE